MTSGPKIIFIAVVIFVLGFVVFIFRFGIPEKIGSLSGTFRLGTPDMSGFKYYESVNVYRGASRSTSSSGGATTPAPAKKTVEQKPKNIPAGFTEEQISPYFGMVKISSVSAGSLTSRGYVRLSANFSEDILLNITGWTLRAERGSQIVPSAVSVYDPSGLAQENSIFLAKGEYLIMYTNTSAIGINFRLNKCMGYLENNQNFSPALPMSCPNPVYDFNMASVTGACQDYMRFLSSCRLPRSSPPVPNTDYACREYLSQIHMKGCYDRHRSDADFLSREWRAWTGRVFLDSRHDTVHLLDGDGKLVDIRSY